MRLPFIAIDLSPQVFDIQPYRPCTIRLRTSARRKYTSPTHNHLFIYPPFQRRNPAHSTQSVIGLAVWTSGSRSLFRPPCSSVHVTAQTRVQASIHPRSRVITLNKHSNHTIPKPPQDNHPLRLHKSSANRSLNLPPYQKNNRGAGISATAMKPNTLNPQPYPRLSNILGTNSGTIPPTILRKKAPAAKALAAIDSNASI